MGTCSLFDPCLSPPYLLPPLDESPFQDPYVLFPSLVVTSINLDDKILFSEDRHSGFGFIVDSNGENGTVWGSSWFLYEDEPYKVEGKKELRRGKVYVSSLHPRLAGRFEGAVVYVDFLQDICVIKFRDSKLKLPPAKLAAYSPLVQSYTSLDFYNYLHSYFVHTYKFVSMDGIISGVCGSYLHMDRGFQSPHGIILNGRLEVVGIKRNICQLKDTTAHVIPINIIAKSLHSYTYRVVALNDVRLSSYAQNKLVGEQSKPRICNSDVIGIIHELLLKSENAKIKSEKMKAKVEMMEKEFKRAEIRHMEAEKNLDIACMEKAACAESLKLGEDSFTPEDIRAYKDWQATLESKQRKIVNFRQDLVLSIRDLEISQSRLLKTYEAAEQAKLTTYMAEQTKEVIEAELMFWREKEGMF